MYSGPESSKIFLPNSSSMDGNSSTTSQSTPYSLVPGIIFAPIASLIALTSAVGPTIRLVPVSKIPSQPPLQAIVSPPPTDILLLQKRYKIGLISMIIFDFHFLNTYFLPSSIENTYALIDTCQYFATLRST